MTYIIIAITTIISLIAFKSHFLFNKFQFTPYLIFRNKQLYRFITHAFIHANLSHLIINMLTLFFIGVYVESAFKYLFETKGIFFYILLYIGGIIVSSYPSFEKHKKYYNYNAVGASGAISAVVFSYILFDPLGKIYIYFIPFGIPAVVFGIAYLIYSAIMAKRGKDNIDHSAHFFGALFGFVFTLILHPVSGKLFIEHLLNWR